MGKHLHMHARWSVTAALLLLVVSLGTGLALAGQSRTSALASPSPVARTLDLAAMALAPFDLDDVGLTGFGQQTSEFLTLEEQVEQMAAAPSLDKDAEAIRRSGLSVAGFQLPLSAAARASLGAGFASLQLRTFVAPYVIEYASIEGAAAGSATSKPRPLHKSGNEGCAGNWCHRRSLRDYVLSAGKRQS